MGLVPNVDEAETSSGAALRRKSEARGKVGLAAREERVGFDARFELPHERKAIREILGRRGDERHRFEPAMQNERNQKPSWRGQSVLSRLFREERSRRGFALDSNDPDFRSVGEPS